MYMSYDILIVGTGISALYCALNLDENLNILMLTKTTVRETNSYLAQGGISTALDEKDVPLFINDTLKAGKYKNSNEAVQVLAKESMDIIKDLEAINVPLDHCGKNLSYTKEGAHSVNRIVHCSDKTGEVVSEFLLKKIVTKKNITIVEQCCVVDIIESDGKCIGAIAVKNNRIMNIQAKVTIFATGGIGGIFRNSTNQRVLTGDGISIASKHNIKLKDINYIQFHPTALYEEENSSRRFLISEAVRGEGARLLNCNGERFIDELLPRDVVSDAINKEIKRSGIPYVYLDISFKDSTYIKQRFPLIYSECMRRGFDISKRPIPVTPTQHYFMGGIQVDLNSESSMENLYALGECSCTGVHGANRLASNSLLEAIVFSKRAAKNINSRIVSIELPQSIDLFKFSLEDLELNSQEKLKGELKIRWDKYSDELFNC